MVASNDVFISYRRELGFAWAKLVWDDLRDHGIDAFLDLENVRDAGSFDTKILRQIEGRPYFLIILTHGSLDRCCEAGDWLRLELEHAVIAGRVIVPLVISSFDFSEADTALDEELAHALRSANGVTLVPDYFDAAMERLRDDRLVPIERDVRPFGPTDEAFAEEARQRASQLPPPTPPVGGRTIPAPPGSAGIDPVDQVEPTTVPPEDVATAPATVPPDDAGTSRTGRRRRWSIIALVAVLAVALGAIATVLVATLGGDDAPTDRLEADEVLTAGDRLTTDDGRTVLVMGDNGVLRGMTDGSVWFSEPPASRAVPGSVARMQEDGNFVIYESEGSQAPTDATFATGTQGNRDAYLILLEGSFEIRSESDVRLFPRPFQRSEEPATTTAPETTVATTADTTTP